MKRFDGPASGNSLTNATHRDDIDQAATDYETDSGSDSEADPDHYCSVPRNARGVDMKLVSITFTWKNELGNFELLISIIL